MKLNLIEELADDDLDDDEIRDFVTHIFGRYSSKIEFLGFKTSTGKMYCTGNPNLGSPFIVGKIANKLHYLKSGVTDGAFNFIRLFFEKTPFTNLNLEFKLEDMNKEFFQKYDSQYDDEKYLNDIKDPIKLKKNIFIPIIEDHFFFEKDEDDIFGDNIHDLIRERRGLEEKVSGNDQDLNYEEEELILKEIDKYMTEYQNLDTLENLVTEEQPQPEQKFAKWDKISTKSLNVAGLFSNDGNLESFVAKFRDDVQSEFEYKKSKLIRNEKFNNNFYVKFSNLGKPNESDSENILKLEKDFLKCIRKCQDALKGTNKNNNIKEVQEKDQEENLGDRDQTDEKNEKTHSLTLKEAVKKWKYYSDFLNRKVIRFGLCGALGIAKAIDILNNLENEFEDKQNSMEVKISALNILVNLIEKKRILKSFNKEKNSFLFMKDSLMNRMNKTHNDTEKKPKEDVKQLLLLKKAEEEKKKT
jgi:hypothetical protein